MYEDGEPHTASSKRTELKEYADKIHWSLYSTILSSWPIVGSAMDAAEELAVCEAVDKMN